MPSTKSAVVNHDMIELHLASQTTSDVRAANEYESQRKFVAPNEDQQVLVASTCPIGGEQLGHVADHASHLGCLVNDVKACHVRCSRRRRQKQRT